jgi:hypothetical protein
MVGYPPTFCEAIHGFNLGTFHVPLVYKELIAINVPFF